MPAKNALHHLREPGARFSLFSRYSTIPMHDLKHFCTALATLMVCMAASAQLAEKVVDIPTRPGVTQRMLIVVPPQPKAAVILLAGGHGGLQISPSGFIAWGENNFVVRTRLLFAAQGLAVAVLDAPSDRQSPPYLSGFRQTPEHAADLKAAIAWMRQTTQLPVWLVGTSRGTQSAAYVATRLSGPDESDGPDGPDGIVLSSTILTDPQGRPVPAMPLEKIRVPVLVVHHEQDGCRLCAFSEVPALTTKLTLAARSQVLSFKGGENRGDPCGASGHHGYAGIELDVVRQTAQWLLASRSLRYSLP